MANLTLKLKTKKGQLIVKSLNSEDTISQLKKVLVESTGISESSLIVMVGFPPKPLNLSLTDQTLQDCGIKSGDTLIIKEDELQMNEEIQIDTPRKHTTESVLESPGLLMRKVVPADNSCLFTSIGFVMGGKVDVTSGSFMRQIIAEAVSNDTETYSEAILGKPNKDYCDWILKTESWGGAIELSILSTFYGMEIAVVDTINAIINRFGEDKSYFHRVFLIFDGIHYDPLYLESNDASGSIQTIFPTTDDNILREAEQLAVEAQSSRQFTDVNKFTLRCNDCQIFLKGQVEAIAHAKATGHGNFGEVS
uniref:Ubiquitin thioesterase OTU n=1 Tax=Clastoptera arizonana TaxID=38151 RepID=A0A1B6CSE9_9HEMI